MSGHKEDDDDFFADIYGDDEKKPQPEKEAPKEPPKEASEPKEAAPSETAPAAAAPAAAPVSDPRLAFLQGSGTDASASMSAPSAPAVPAGLPAGFDPAQFGQQFQQLQQLAAQGSGQSGGFSAGKIFIPAKDEGKMFIGGLNWETTDESMRSYFSQFGEVTDCLIMRDNISGRSRGFGFLTFKDPKVVSAVLSREHVLDGKIIDPKRAIPREEQDKTAKIFVGGVGADVTEEDFKSFFEQYGTVIDAQLMMDKDTGRPRGFGFVTFDSDQAVETIVAEQFVNLKGKPIEVKRAEPRAREHARDDGRNGRMGYNNMQNNMYQGGGMDPAAMAQYYQQWQAYMAQMQQMMQQQGPGMDNPMMGMYQRMMQQQQVQSPQMPGAQMHTPPINAPTAPAADLAQDQHESRDFRRDRRRGGNDERRRSRSPGSGGHRRRRDRDGGRDRYHR